MVISQVHSASHYRPQTLTAAQDIKFHSETRLELQLRSVFTFFKTGLVKVPWTYLGFGLEPEPRTWPLSSGFGSFRFNLKTYLKDFGMSK